MMFKTSLRKASLDLDYSKDYLVSIKLHNPTKWEKILSFDSYDIKRAVELYSEYVEDLVNKVIELFYEYDNGNQFDKWLDSVGLKPSTTSISVLLFGTLEPMKRHNTTVILLEDILKKVE